MRIETQESRALLRGYAPMDRRHIIEWTPDNVTLPLSYAQSGRLSFVNSRHLVKPLEAVQDDGIREASIAGAIQTGKTLIVETGIAWAACNSPGPIMWTLQTDDDAKEHCRQRFMEMLKSVQRIRDMLPADRHAVTTNEIYFGPFFLTVNGANINNLQRVSIRWKFNSEVWLWKQGLLSDARGRVTAFEKAGNSKMINESQGGTENDDFDLACKSGNLQIWSVKCFGCGVHSPLEFEGRMMADPKERACVVWNADARRPDGSWNVARAAETARWKCRLCGCEHDDSPRTRAKWNEDGAYLVQRHDAPPEIVSFRWEALVSRSLGALVAQFLEARRQQKNGVPQAMMDFTQKRRALAWKDETSGGIVNLTKAGYLLSALKPKEKLENEATRIMTIDRQRDHFWATLWIFFNDGGMRLGFRSRVNTREQCREVQTNFEVSDKLTFQDSGYFPAGAYADCAAYGWTALKGGGDNYFLIELKLRGGKTAKIRRMWSNVTNVLQDGKYIPLIHWASDPIKDILHALRSGRGTRFEVADDAGEEFERQMNGDRKKQLVNKRTGKLEFRWCRVHANHYWDCSAMAVAAGLILGLIASPEPVTDEPEQGTENGKENGEKTP